MRVEASPDTLDITVDRESARQWMHRRKSEVRWAWSKIDWRQAPPAYGLELLDDSDTKSDQDVVVLIHGLNSRPEDLAQFIPVVEQAGLCTATFRYPNDQPIDASSRLLSTELHRFARKHPQRNVRILAHSMGGLVARGAVETDLDPGNVVQLMMVGTPNHGSSLASIATFMDCYEFCTSTHYQRTGALVESVADGLGEATADLTPHSVFLDRLNRHPRNPRIRYSILLGTGGPMSSEEMTRLCGAVQDYTNGNALTRFLSSKLNRALTDLDEVIEGKGDGVVSCKRGNLTGVADIVKLPFSHAGVLHPHAPGARAARAEILQRLQ